MSQPSVLPAPEVLQPEQKESGKQVRATVVLKSGQVFTVLYPVEATMSANHLTSNVVHKLFTPEGEYVFVQGDNIALIKFTAKDFQ